MSRGVGKQRLDQRLVADGLAPSRQRAQAFILAGAVLVDDVPSTKAGTMISDAAVVRLRSGMFDDYASRGAHKLKPALESFDVDPTDRICMDVGASTGGFTDVLLRGNAARVYAVDVGYGQLAWKLRDNAKVVVLERTNARYLTEEQIPEPIHLVVVDVSFISVKLLLSTLWDRCADQADVLVMVKPQFEVGKGRVGKGGVVRDESIRLESIQSVADAAIQLGYTVHGQRDNDIRGPKGNLETFLYLCVDKDLTRLSAGESEVEFS